jgi:hypothetical protein
VDFQGGLLAESLRRLDLDPEFASRHQGPIVRWLRRALRIPGVWKLIEGAPPGLSTPMCLTVRRRL